MATLSERDARIKELEDTNERLANIIVGYGDQVSAAVKKGRLMLLRSLAADARIRGDIGKPDGVEAWTWLNGKADQLEFPNTAKVES